MFAGGATELLPLVGPTQHIIPPIKVRILPMPVVGLHSRQFYHNSFFLLIQLQAGQDILI